MQLTGLLSKTIKFHVAGAGCTHLLQSNGKLTVESHSIMNSLILFRGSYTA